MKREQQYYDLREGSLYCFFMTGISHNLSPGKECEIKCITRKHRLIIVSKQ